MLGLAAALIFTGVGGMLYLGLKDKLEERSQHYLRDEVNILRTLLAKPNSLEAVQREIDLESGTLEYVQHFVRVVDSGGATLLETPGMEVLIPVAAFPPPTRGDAQKDTPIHWRSADGRQLFTLKTVHARRADDGSQVELQVALNVTRRAELLSSYADRLLATIMVGVAASLLAARLIARNGLRPLRDITQHTRKISASHLDERLRPEDWPRELHELASSFDLMLARLHDSFTRLSSFASNMAHEFRTPLNNLMGETEVALIQSRSSEELRAVLESNLEEYQRLAQIVDSLLFLARVEGGSQPPQCSELMLDVEMQSMANYYQAMAEEQGIQLGVQPMPLLKLHADASLLRRAVANLLNNAIRYTPSGGKIILSAQPLPGGGASVTVADTGCGIDPAEIPRLCDRFYRVDATRESHPQGQGLGLALIKSIMDLHGGTIDIQSAPGAGTSMTLYFPARSPD